MFQLVLCKFSTSILSYWTETTNPLKRGTTEPICGKSLSIRPKDKVKMTQLYGWFGFFLTFNSFIKLKEYDVQKSQNGVFMIQGALVTWSFRLSTCYLSTCSFRTFIWVTTQSFQDENVSTKVAHRSRHWSKAWLTPVTPNVVQISISPPTYSLLAHFSWISPLTNYKNARLFNLKKYKKYKHF